MKILKEDQIKESRVMTGI